MFDEYLIYHDMVYLTIYFHSIAYSAQTEVNPEVQMSSEILAFQKTVNVESPGGIDQSSGGDNSIIEKFKDFISAILIADFFLIMFFLLWFLLAAVLQSSFPVILERFQDIFQPVVVPSLTLLMVGSIASGPLGKKSISDSQT